MVEGKLRSQTSDLYIWKVITSTAMSNRRNVKRDESMWGCNCAIWCSRLVEKQAPMRPKCAPRCAEKAIRKSKGFNLAPRCSERASQRSKPLKTGRFGVFLEVQIRKFAPNQQNNRHMKGNI